MIRDRVPPVRSIWRARRGDPFPLLIFFLLYCLFLAALFYYPARHTCWLYRQTPTAGRSTSRRMRKPVYFNCRLTTIPSRPCLLNLVGRQPFKFRRLNNGTMQRPINWKIFQSMKVDDTKKNDRVEFKVDWRLEATSNRKKKIVSKWQSVTHVRSTAATSQTPPRIAGIAHSAPIARRKKEDWAWSG